MKTKTQSSWQVLNKQWLHKCCKVYEDYIEFETEKEENAKSAERQKNYFPKERVENADSCKPTLTK